MKSAEIDAIRERIAEDSSHSIAKRIGRKLTGKAVSFEDKSKLEQFERMKESSRPEVRLSKSIGNAVDEVVRLKGAESTFFWPGSHGWLRFDWEKRPGIAATIDQLIEKGEGVTESLAVLFEKGNPEESYVAPVAFTVDVTNAEPRNNPNWAEFDVYTLTGTSADNVLTSVHFDRKDMQAMSHESQEALIMVADVMADNAYAQWQEHLRENQNGK